MYSKYSSGGARAESLNDRLVPRASRFAGLRRVASRARLALGRTLLVSLALPFAALGSSCTSMGFDHPALRDSIDYGPQQQVRMCVYLDDGLTADDANALLDSWNDQAPIYNLYIKPVSYQHMTRTGFFHSGILEQVRNIPLGSSCDRVLYFVNRNVGDAAYGLMALATGAPEVLGEVDDETLTHGYVVARRATINQLVMTPSSVTQHELFHLLGCPAHFDMADCYERIHNLKLAEKKLDAQGYYQEKGEESFYPTFASRTDSMLVSREQVSEYQGFESATAAAALAAR